MGDNQYQMGLAYVFVLLDFKPLNLRDYRRLSRVLSCDGEWSVLRLQRVLRSLLVCNEEQGLLFDQQFQQVFQTDFDASDIVAPVDIQRRNNELTLLLATLESNHPDVDQKYNHPYITEAIKGEEGEPWTLRRRFYQSKEVWLASIGLLAVIELQANITIPTLCINRYWLPLSLTSTLLSVLLMLLRNSCLLKNTKMIFSKTNEIVKNQQRAIFYPKYFH